MRTDNLLLAIDVGNTNTVLALYRSPPLASPRRCWPTGASPPIARLPSTKSHHLPRPLRLALAGHRPGHRRHRLLGRPAARLHPAQRGRALLPVKPIFVEPGTRTGVPILTDNPAEVGADRIVNWSPPTNSSRTHPPAALPPTRTSSLSTSAPPPPSMSSARAANTGRSHCPASASPPTRSSPAPPACPASISASRSR